MTKHTVKVRSSVRTITPQVAKKWLEKCNGEFQRPLRLTYVETMARAMQSGQWANNGETIVFSDTGKLLDGQHRLSAVVLANVNIMATVSTGVLEKDFDTIDSGLTRTMGDVLKIRGESDYSDLAAALRRLYNFDRTKGASTERSDAPPTKRDLEDTLQKHPSVRESVKLARGNRSLVAPSIIAPLHYLFSKYDKKLADQFVMQFASGENLTRNNPVYKLREKIIDSRRNKGSEFKPIALVYLCFRTFKAMLDTKSGNGGQLTTQMERLLLPTGHNPNLVLPDLTATRVLTAPKGKDKRPKRTAKQAVAAGKV